MIIGGRFVPGDGYDISSDGRAATFTDDKTASQKFEDGVPIVKKLKWVWK